MITNKDQKYWNNELLRGCFAHDLNRVKTALRNGADVNAESADVYTALMAAAIDQDIDTLDFLLSQPNLDVNKTNLSGMTALLLSVEKANVNSVHSLLKHPNIDVNFQSSNGSTALIISASCGNKAMVQALLKHPKINLNAAKDGWTALFWAVRFGHPEIVELLKDAGAK